MKTSLVAWSRVGALSFSLFWAGCASTEWEAAQQLDRTTEIVEQVSDWLAADPELSRQKIVLDGFKGDMRLKGQVASAEQKARAAKLVWAARGVKSVDNQLEVLEQASPEASSPR